MLQKTASLEGWRLARSQRLGSGWEIKGSEPGSINGERNPLLLRVTWEGSTFPRDLPLQD